MGEFGHCLTEVDERLSPGVEVAYGEAFGFKEDGLDAKPRRQPANALLTNLLAGHERDDTSGRSVEPKSLLVQTSIPG